MTGPAASSRPIDLLTVEDRDGHGVRRLRDLLDDLRRALAREHPENRWERQNEPSEGGRRRWILDEPAREIGDLLRVIEIGLRGDDLGVRIVEPGLSATLLAPRPGPAREPDAIVPGLLAMLDAVGTALEVLPSGGTDAAGLVRFGAAPAGWLLAARVLGERHLETGRGVDDHRTVLSASTATPWSPSIVEATDGRPIPMPEGVRERFDAACPIMVRIEFTGPDRARSVQMFTTLKISPVIHRAAAGDDGRHHDALSTMRAVAMAVEAGAMEP